ncbi:MAG TPA: aquaporin [Candidatus Paceibacterota bacterium]
MNIKQHAIEFFATFLLTLAIFASLLVAGGITTPLSAGIMLGLLAFMLGSLTCLHVNPAVTVALLAFKKIAPKDAAFHILAQFAGAAFAMLLVRTSGSVSAFVEQPVFDWHTALAEFVGTFFFAFGIASVVFKPAPAADQVSEPATDLTFPFVIGSSLAMGIMIASGLGSTAMLNPAVAFGLGSFTLSYVLTPIAGAILGMWLYTYFAKPAKAEVPVQN